MIRLSRKTLCLDWDKRSLRIVAARVGKGRTFLEDAHSHRLPTGLDPDDPQAMGEFIRGMLRRHRLHFRSVVVDIPRERAVINRLRLPPTPDAEVAAAVRFQAMKELPFPLDTAAMDYVVTGRDQSGLVTEVLLAAVTVEALDRVRLTCEAAGLTPARIGLRPYANLISVHRVKDLGQRRVLFLDVGPSATEIDVIQQDALAFARSANVNVPPVPLDPALHDDSHVIPIAELTDLEGADEAVEAAVGELLVEVTRTLQAYRATEPDAVIDEVVVAGGTGIEAQLADRLSQRLNLPAELFDPTEALGVEPAEGPKLRSFSAALGLAWGASQEGALAIDFLNPKRPVSRHEILQRRARMGLAAAGLVLALVVGVLGMHYSALATRCDALRAANRKLAAQVEAKTELLNRIEEIQEWATDAVWPDELLNIVQVAIEAAGRAGEKMVVQEITLDSLSRSPGIVLRNVYFRDRQVPADLVERLSAIQADGQPLYEAVRDAWVLVGGEKFTGKSDIRIQLRRLQEFRDQAPKRAKVRKDRLRNLDLP